MRLSNLLLAVKNRNFAAIYNRIYQSSVINSVPPVKWMFIAICKVLSIFFAPLAHANARKIYSTLLENKKRAPEFVEDKFDKNVASRIRAIAYYLPQFHPFAENEAWWGAGFTEWTNVARGFPNYLGHQQPRIPRDFGFYDLRNAETQKRQAETAARYGIEAFCYHFYWFNGRRLMEMPVLRHLEDKSIDFKFCLNWANENWSRRWDGKSQDILMPQNHNAEDDIQFISHVAKYMRDHRYLKVDNRPLLLVYRPELFPDFRATIARWKAWTKDHLGFEVYVVAVESFQEQDELLPYVDSLTDFAPNTFPLKEISQHFCLTNPKFEGSIRDYRSAKSHSLRTRKNDARLLKSICLAWDNTARRGDRGLSLEHSSPRDFRDWLESICKWTDQKISHEEKLIFINAWNEWAEGTYLEPDQKYGYAYLHELATVLAKFPQKAW